MNKIFLIILFFSSSLYAVGDGGSDFCDDLTRSIHEYNKLHIGSDRDIYEPLHTAPKKNVITYGIEPRIKKNGLEFLRNETASYSDKEYQDILKKYERFWSLDNTSVSLNFMKFDRNNSNLYEKNDYNKILKEIAGGSFLQIDKIYSDNRYSSNLELTDAENEVFEITPRYAYITHIDDKSISEFSDYELQNIFYPEKIGLESKFTILTTNFQKEDIFKIHTVILKSYDIEITQVELTFEINELIRIDSSQNEHEATFHFKYLWHDDRLLKIAKKIGDKWNMKKGFWCKWTLDEWYFEEDWFLWHPDLIIKNITEEKKFNKTDDITLSYLAADTISGEPTLTMSRDVYSNSIFRSPFQFQNFPFDKQYLLFDIYESQHSHLDLDLVVTPYLFDNFEDFIWTKDRHEDEGLPDWKITDFSINPWSEKSVVWGTTTDSVQIKLIVERNFMYYIYKVLIPIFIILIISFATYLIPSKQLESKLTLSIVCFLALIAYNFVIDESLPKLSYLTIMDYIILTSYIFAAIPSFYGVVSFLFYIKNKNEGLTKFDIIFCSINTLSYAAIVLAIIYYSTINSSGFTSSLLTSFLL